MTTTKPGAALDIERLESLVAAGLSGGSFALDVGSVAGLAALAAAYLPGNALRLADASMPAELQTASAVVVIGAGVEAPFLHTSCKVEFTVANGQASITVTATGTAGWALTSACPPLAGSVPGQLAISGSPTLVLRSGAETSLTLAMELSLTGSGGLPALVGGQVSVNGAITLAGNGASVTALSLSSAVVTDVPLGISTTSGARVTLGITQSENPAQGATAPVAYVGLAADIETKAGPVTVEAQAYDLDRPIRFQADLPAGALAAALSDLGALVGGADLESLLPTAGLDIASTFDLVGLFFEVDPGGTPKVPLLGLSLRSRGTWTILGLPSGGKIQVENADVEFTWAGTGKPSVALGGTFEIPTPGPTKPRLALTASTRGGFAVSGTLAPDSVISFADLAAFFLGKASGAPDFAVRRLSFSATSSAAFDIELEADGFWPIVALTDGLVVAVEEAAFSFGTGKALSAHGTLRMGGVALDLSATHDGTGFSIAGGVAPGGPIPLGAFVAELVNRLGVTFSLPACLQSIDLDALSIAIDTGAGSFALKGAITFALSQETDASLSLDIALAKDTAGAYAASFDAKLFVGNATFEVTFADDTATLRSSAGTTALSDLIKAFDPALALPAQVPDVQLAEISVALDPATRALTVTASGGATWDPGAGAGSSATVNISIEHTPASPSGAKAGTSISAKLDAEGPFNIAEGLSLGQFGLSFTWSQGSSWSVAGSVVADLLGAPTTLGAAFSSADGTRSIALTSSGGPTLDLGPVGSLSSSAVSLTWSHGATNAFELDATGKLKLDGVCDLAGTLSLAEQNGVLSLSFAPSSATVSVPLPFVGTSDAALRLTLDALSIVDDRSAGGAGLSLRAGVDLAISGLPDGVQKVLPATVHVDFAASRSGVTLSVSPFFSYQTTLPPATLGSQSIPLGRTLFEGTSLSVTLGSEISFEVELGLGLPSQLNDIFGTSKPVRVFETWDGTENTVTRLRIAMATDGSVSLQLVTSPIAALQFQQDGSEVDATIDLGECGALTLVVPTFTWDGTQLSASGGFKLDPDRPLAIPLTPLLQLLDANDLGGAAATLPQKIPLQGIKVYDPQQGVDVDALISALEKVIKLPDALTSALKSAAKVIDKLPPSLLDYLNIELPDSLFFSFSFSFSGKIALDVSVYGPGTSRDQAIPLKLLLPGMGPLGPQLTGISLYGLGFGELFDGVLFQLVIDADVEMFPLVPLVAALEMPAGSPLTPAASFKNHLVVDKLQILIVFAEEVVIPVPLFFTELAWTYLGLEGVTLQIQLQFPEPTWSLTGAVALFTSLEKFLTEKSALLDPSLPLHGFDVTFTIGPTYVALPSYLGGATLGTTKGLPTISLWGCVAHLLNAVKTLSVDDVVASIPIDDRVGSATGVSFGPVTTQASWLLTTPAEFTAGAWQKLPIEATEVDELLSVLPAPGSGANPRGLVAFLAGAWSIGDGSLTTWFALAGSGSGFATGLSLSGSLGSLVSANLSGDVVIDTKAACGFHVTGTSKLTIASQVVAHGSLDADDSQFSIDGTVSLFPAGSPLQVTGTLSATLGTDGAFSVTVSDADVALAGFELASPALALSGSALTLSGTWLESVKLVCNAAVDGDLLTLGGTVTVDVDVQRTVGPLVDPITGITVVDALPLDLPAVAATVGVTLGPGGFTATVDATFAWQGSTLQVPRFTLSASPADVAALAKAVADQIVDNASAIFAQAVSGMAGWIAAGQKGWATLAGTLADAASASTQWSPAAWNAVRSWSTSDWQSASAWPASAWNATRSWSDDAWQATTQWPAAGWEATKSWTDATWQATTTWPASAWSASVSWTQSQFENATQTIWDTLHVDHAAIPHWDAFDGAHVDTHADIGASLHVDKDPHVDTSIGYFGGHWDVGHHVDAGGSPHIDKHLDTTTHVDTDPHGHIDTL